MSVPLLSIRDVHVELGGNSILNGVTAQIERGRITALIGLNGSGKTTLLRTILKENPCHGEIRFHCGHDHSKPAPEHIGYVPQKLNIDAKLPLTVRDLLALALQKRPLFLGISRKTTVQIDAILDRVKAKQTLLDKPVDKISGGELQRILLGLAIHPQPELLLLDEPAAGIDFQALETFYHTIERLNRESGVTILLVSHDLSVVSQHSHHVLCLKDGRIECEGPPKEVLTGEMLSRIFGSEKGIFPHHHDHGPDCDAK
jgi:zinc transport system ATP-binding protein